MIVKTLLAACLSMGSIALAAQPTAGESTPAIDPASIDPQVQAEERERRVNARVEQARREARFNQLDVDGDGFLSKQEFAAGEDVAASPETLDQDADGRISRSEFAALELHDSDAADEGEWQARESVGKSKDVGGEKVEADPDR